MKRLLIIVLLFSKGVIAQTHYDIDTSYTVKSTYAKLVKKYPFIKIAKANKRVNDTEIQNAVSFTLLFAFAIFINGYFLTSLA